MDAYPMSDPAPDAADRLLAAAAFAYVTLAGATGLVLAVAGLLCGRSLWVEILMRGLLLTVFGLDS